MSGSPEPPSYSAQEESGHGGDSEGYEEHTTPHTHGASIQNQSTDLVNLSSSAQEEDTPSLPPRPEAEHVSDATPVQPSAPASAPHAQDEHELPQITVLRGMFPDFDRTVLQSVLESVDYDQDRAIDVLLGMSDPEYISTQAPAAPEHDLALDEQLARQLALEDEQQAPRARGQSWPRRGDVPYEPRHNAPAHPQQQQQDQGYVTGSERGDFQEFQETLGKMAESGKRTFSSLVSKAKAKINEYNQTRTGTSPSYPVYPQTQGSPPPNVDRHAASQAFAQQYYDNYGAESPEGHVVNDAPISLHGEKSQFEPGARTDSMKGYDVGLGSSYAAASSSPPARSTSPLASPSRPSMSSRPSSETPRPTPTGGNINAAKLGLLPKKPVSLLIPQNNTNAARTNHEEDELEYVENPFEEGHD